MLRSEQVVKRFNEGMESEFTCLHGVDLSIHNGEMALVGPSGAGKTTLLNILSGIDYANDGKVYFKEREVRFNGGREYRSYLRSRGFVFQHFNLFEDLNAEENVRWMLQQTQSGRRVGELIGMALDNLTKVGLREHADKFPSQLSGGQQQRVAVARSLSAGELIFADEPTGALDSKSSAEIEALFHELNEKYGATIVMVTHDNALAERCGRLIRMVDGKLDFDSRSI